MRLVGGNFSRDPTADMSGISSVDGSTGTALFSEATQAYAQEAWETGPTTSSVDWMANKITDIFLPESDIRMSNKLSEDELEDRKANSFYGKYITVPSDGFTDWEYDNALAETHQRMVRQSVMARAPSGLLQGAKRLGVELAVGMADPTNVLAAFIPRGLFIAAGKTALVETKSMQNLTKSVENYSQALDDMTAIQRMGSRAKLGAAESVPGAALVEVPIYAGAHLRGEDYTIEDVFMSIGVGIVIDTGIHVGGGALYDVAEIPARAERRRLATEKQAGKNADELTAYEEVKQQQEILILQADNFSTMQRFQSSLSPADQAAVLQTGLSQMAYDTKINMQDLIGTIQAKMDERMSPAAIRMSVLKEYKQRQYDAEGTSMNRREVAAYDNSVAKLDRLFDEKRDLEADLAGRGPIAGNIGKKKAAIRDRLNQESQARLDAVDAEIEATSRPMVDSAVKSKLDGRTDVEDLLLADMPGDLRVQMFAEIDKRIRAAKEGDPARLGEQIREMLDGLKRTAERPESQRTYREGAEAVQKKAGAKQTPEAANTVLAEQEADAVENANMAAEATGTEYTTDAETDAVIKTIDDTAATVDKFRLCMSAVI